MAKKLPATSTNMMPRSLSPNASTASGTQHTLGSVCRPRNSGPKNLSSSGDRHIATPSTVPRTMLMPKPASNRALLTRRASTS